MGFVLAAVGYNVHRFGRLNQAAEEELLIEEIKEMMHP
jgi:hypothetical protein